MYAPQIYNILCFEHGNRRSIKYVGLDFLLHRHKKRRFLCKFVNLIHQNVLMVNFILILINSIALIGTILWLINDRGWEPLVTSLTLSATLIGLLFTRNKRKDKSGVMKQKVKNNSIGIQAGRDININNE